MTDATTTAPMGAVGPLEAGRGRPARWPWVAVAVFVACAIGGMVLVIANRNPIAEQVPFIIAFALFGAVGAAIASRDRGNRIGLLFLWGSCMAAVAFLAGEAVTYLVDRGTDSGPAVVVLAYVAGLGWVVGVLPVLFLLPLLFPTGTVPSPRWRPLLWAIVTLLVVFGFAIVLGSPTLTGSVERAEVVNPLYVPATRSIGEIFDGFALLYLGVLGASVLSLVLRFRRSRGLERQQDTPFV